MNQKNNDNSPLKSPWYKNRIQAPRPWLYMKIVAFFTLVSIALSILFFVFQNYAPKAIFIVPGIVCVLILLAAMRLRRMFRPLRLLVKGVEEISNGHLDFQFPAFGHGEFQFLAESFNRMAKHVKEMIAERDQLLRDVSHEIRAPLTRLRIVAEMTPDGKLKNAMMRDLTDIETMLNELLETQRLKSGYGKLSLGPVDLNRLSMEMIEKYKDRKPGLKFIKASPVVVVTADEDRVRTVLQNLIENAFKYSVDQEKEIEITAEEIEDGVLVSVQDYGTGIPKEEQEKVFEPFYRVDKSRTKSTGGYGLGLNLCAEIMKAHGGDIKLESQFGHGTKVILFFKKQ